MPAIEFWFDFASNYSYLSMLRIRALADAAEVDIILRPFLLGPIFKEQGWDNSPFVLQPLKGRYVWRDMQRQCDKYALPWRQPSAFPRNGLLAARVALQGHGRPWLTAFCEQVMLANFADDREISEPALLASLLAQLGQDGQALLAAANQPEARQAMRERGIDARSRGIFGAPTFFVGADMFWGDDRLEDAIALAVRHGSAT